MINTSQAYRQKVKQDGRVYSARGYFTFASGQTVELANDSFMQGGIKINDSTSADNELSLGMAAINKVTVTLKNYDGRWNSYDFSGAVLNLQIGLLLPDGTSEWLQKGFFTVYDPVSLGGVIIEVSAKDNMQKFDRKYDSQLDFPASLGEILRDACTRCGVVLASLRFTNDDYVVAKRPSDDATTYRDIVSFIAQLAGCWARINNLGELVLGWYDADHFYQDTGDVLDGNDALTASGNPATFDAYPDTLIRRLNVTGNTTQPTSKQGKNLFDAQRAPDIISNAAVSNIVPGGFKITGTLSHVYNCVHWILHLVPGWTYNLSFTSTSDLPEGGVASVYGSDNKWITGDLRNFYFTVPSDGYIRIVFFTNQTTAGIYSATFSQIQLEPGQQKTPYEQFQPESPSPGYQAPISGVTYVEKWEGTLAGGRNLLLNSDFSKVQQSSSVSVNNGVVTMVGVIGIANLFGIHLSPYAIQNLRGKQITGGMFGTGNNIAYGTTNPWVGAELSIHYVDGSNDWFDLWGGKNFPVGTSTWGKIEKTYQVKDKDILSIGLSFYIRDASGTVQFKLPKWEIGASATDWTPAPEDLPSYQKIALPQTLYSLPDSTADNFDAISGTGSQKVGKLVADGTQSLLYYYHHNNQSDFTVALSVNGIAGSKNVISGRFTTDERSANGHVYGVTNPGTGVFFVNVPDYYFGITSSDTSDQAKAKINAWLATSPTTVLYPLATPQQITGTAQHIQATTETLVSVDNGGIAEVIYSGPDAVSGGSFYPVAPTVNAGSFVDYSQQDAISGGGFKDYSQTDVLNGGDFINYGTRMQNVISGGVFRRNLLPPADISFLKSCKIALNDVCITGVRIIPDDTDKAACFEGTSDYVVSIEKNPLAQDNLEQLTASIALKLMDFSFRPMQVSALDDPSIEAGDVAWVTDPKGLRYQTIVSNLTWTINSYETFAADAELQAEQQQTRFSASAKAVQTAKEETSKQIGTYDLMVQQLASTMALAAGTFQTVEKLDDGSQIVYLHDKPTLKESQKIWKHTANAFAVSNDGGTTWSGMTADGNIIAAILTVIGINCDWIQIRGKISSPVNPRVYFDVSAGIIAASRLVASDNSGIYADVGTEEPQYGTAQGLFLYQGTGMDTKFAQIYRMPDDRHDGANFLSLGRLGIWSCGGIGAKNANYMQFDKDSEDYGTFELRLATPTGSHSMLWGDKDGIRANNATGEIYIPSGDGHAAKSIRVIGGIITGWS